MLQQSASVRTSAAYGWESASTSTGRLAEDANANGRSRGCHGGGRRRNSATLDSKRGTDWIQGRRFERMLLMIVLLLLLFQDTIFGTYNGNGFPRIHGPIKRRGVGLKIREKIYL